MMRIRTLISALLLPLSHEFLRSGQQHGNSPLRQDIEHLVDYSGLPRQLNDGAPHTERPLDYWDNLRNSTTFKTQPGSAIYQVRTEDNETVRLAHVVAIIPFSEYLANGTRRVIDSFAHGGASVILAIKHFNERSSPVVPGLSDIVGDCNVYLTVDINDTVLSPIVASRKVLEHFGRPTNVLSKPFPIALSGATRSAVTEPLSILAGVYDTTVVNGLSTSSSLDNKDMFPTFTRTLPTNKVDSQGVVAYLKSLGITHFGILFIRDPYGNEYNRDLANEAAAENITVVSAAWDAQGGGEASILSALKKLRDTQFRYFFAILAPAIDVHRIVIRNAIDLGIMGDPKHVWLFSEASNILREDSFYTTILNNSVNEDREIASALNGAGLVVLEIPQNGEFNKALREVGTDEEIFDYYTSRFEAPELFNNLNWDPVPNFYQYATYDALISLGIGLCSLEEEFPTGKQVVQAVKNTNFIASSGPISYDKHTGTRTAGSVKAKVINFVVDTSQPNVITPNLRTSAHVNVSSQEVEVLSRFLYHDGSSEPPITLPNLTVEYNYLSTGVRVFGWVIAGLVIVASIFFGWRTYYYRNKNIIRIGQPVFLGFLCVGAALMASAIIPMSLQEPMSQRALDAGCMAVPWLFVMGFATAFSSLFCKLLRLNKVFRGSAGMRHVEVKARDVILPFVILFVANFAILLAWTIVAPLRWNRVLVASYDQFGRSIESYGTCFATSESSTTIEVSSRNAFLVALGVFNFVAVILANYQCYLSRQSPSDFNESYYIGLSMLSILEGFLLGVPILFLTIGKPTAQYVVSSILIFLLCMGILVPIFGSKMFVKKKHAKLRTSEWKRAWRNYDESTTRLRTTAADMSGRNSSSRAFHCGGSSSSALLQHQSSVAAIRARVAANSGSTGSSSSRDFNRRSSSAMIHQSSVAAIRDRVAEKELQDSLRRSAVKTSPPK